MLGRVVVENGVKKIVPLTADCGSGNPVGTVIAVYSNKVPNGYLPCNGVAFDTAQFPVLYALLGDNHTPDLRECTLVGIGQSDRAVGAHDVYTIGQFKDDQLQQHDHDINPNPNIALLSGGQATYGSSDANTGNLYSKKTGNVSTGRTGTTTHGKQVGVNWCIKATSGINENQADNVLSALTPVNTVANGDMHSVTSNAVYSALENRAKVRKSSVRSTIDEMLADLGITDNYIKIAFNRLNTNINNYTSGVIQISTGGPAFGFLLYKLTNGNYSAELMSYDSASGLSIIKFCKSNTGFQGIQYYI